MASQRPSAGQTYPQGQILYPFAVCRAVRWAGAMVGERGSSLYGLDYPPSNQLNQLHVRDPLKAPNPAIRMTPGSMW